MISKLLAAIDRLIEPPRRPTFRQVYVVENQDWLATPSNLTDAEAYEAIVGLYQMGRPETAEEER